MALPKQVEEAADLAEEYMNGLNAEEGESEAGEEVDTEESDEEESEEAADDETNTEEEEERNVFEEKYRVLQGKYDKEVPRLHGELKELKEKIFERLGDIETAKAQPEEKAPEVDDKMAAFKEEYGEDLIGYLDSYFESKMKPAVAEQTKEALDPVQKQVASIEESQVQTAKDEFASYLDSNVNGDWREAASDPKFEEFLAQEDPSGFSTYGELLDKFNQDWDQTRMAKVFNAFYGEGKTETPEKKSSPDKDAIVAPSRKTQAKTPEASDKINWTRESIKQFERDDRAGKYSSEDSQKMWDDLLAAPSENRIN